MFVVVVVVLVTSPLKDYPTIPPPGNQISNASTQLSMWAKTVKQRFLP